MIELPRSYLRRIVGACALCVLGSTLLCAQEEMKPALMDFSPAPKTELALRVRMEWGGGPARRWGGTAEVVGGRCDSTSPLGTAADEPGSMSIANDGRWFVEPRTPRTYDGCDLTIRGQPDSLFIVELSASEGSPPMRHEVPLSSLRDGTYLANLDADGNRLSIRRAPGDRLLVRTKHKTLIFDPGELMSLSVEPSGLGIAPGTELQLTIAICPARTTKSQTTRTFELLAPPNGDAWPDIRPEINLPEAEGVYDVVMELSRRDLSSRLLRQTTLERRLVQVVVLAKTPPRQTEFDPASAQVLTEIDPAVLPWWDRVKDAATPFSKAPVPRDKTGPIDTSLVELRPTPKPEPPSRQIYALTVERPGTPHLVEIEYPADRPQSLGVSLLEPNALGRIAPSAVDLGIDVDEIDCEPPGTRRVKRFVVWPQTAAPQLIVFNRSHRYAYHGKIRWLGPKGTALAYRPWTQDEPLTLPHAKIPEARPDGRLLAAYFDRPSFAENFGASPAIDTSNEASPRQLQDWVTFYDGARRLIEYLHYSGYNGLMLTVAADGGAIYPSHVLEPTPRYDDGALFSTGQDPLRKDVVEMLLRMCDREGLRLIPAVRFTGTLRGLEQARRDGVAGIAPCGPDGTAWTDLHPTDDGAGPHYNPLHDRVQGQMRAVVSELVERYGRHASFGGVAVQLTADGYTQLPGVAWGLDSETLAGFYRSLNQHPPTNEEMPAAAARTLERHREAWIAWRQQELTQFYGELAASTAVASPHHKLYLTTAHAWQRPDLLRRLQPSLPQRSLFEPILREAGLDAQALAALPNVEWMRPYRESSLHHPTEHGADVELNRDASMDRLDGTGRPLVRSAMIFHDSHSKRLDLLEKHGLLPAGQVRLVTQAAAAGSAARRNLIRTLAAHDAATIVDGGGLLMPTAHDDVRRIAAVVRSLPDEPFTKIAGGPSHVVARTLTVGERTYWYVVNDAPWPTTATFRVERDPKASQWNSFGDEKRFGPTSNAPGARWQAQLEPYDVVGGYFLCADASRVTMSDPQAVAPPEVTQQLTARIKRLWAHYRGAIGPPTPAYFAGHPYAGGGFEPHTTTKQPLQGWQADEGSIAVVVNNEGHTGNSSLRLQSTGTAARVTSAPIDMPPSGRLSVSAWLKSPNGAPSLRLAVVGQWNGRPYYRYATIGGEGRGGPELAGEWRGFVFPLYDLPTQGLTDVRIRFELTGPGEVLIDDVEPAEAAFTDHERVELAKAISLAEYRLQEGELGECARLLEGYWPRHLAAYATPAAVDPATIATKPNPAAQPKPPEAPAATEAKRSWWPAFLR